MTQEDKELLFIDLCGRIPYKVRIFEIEPVNNIQSNLTLLSVTNKESVICITPSGGVIGSSIDAFKPYLFPISSMTEEQTEEVHNLIYQGVSESIEETKEWLKTRKENELRPITLTYILSYTLVIDWFCKNHFDYRGLIPMGLAMDATNLNIY